MIRRPHESIKMPETPKQVFLREKEEKSYRLSVAKSQNYKKNDTMKLWCFYRWGWNMQ
jgi:hypothetical protein